MPKTIRELSEELGVSKTAITKFLTPEKRKLFANQIDNRLSISDEGVTLIRKHFLLNKSTKNENQIDNQTQKNENQVVDFNKELLHELAEKNKQIRQLQKNIEQQNKLIDQQQQLTLHANHQIEKLEGQLKLSVESTTNISEDAEPIKQKNKRSWWHLF